MKILILFFTVTLLGCLNAQNTEREVIDVKIAIEELVCKVQTFSGRSIIKLPVFKSFAEASDDGMSKESLFSSYLSATDEDWLKSIFHEDSEIPYRNFTKINSYSYRRDTIEVIQKMDFTYDERRFVAYRIRFTPVYGGNLGFKAIRGVIMEKVDDKWVFWKDFSKLPKEVAQTAQWAIRLNKQLGAALFRRHQSEKRRKELSPLMLELVEKCTHQGGFFNMTRFMSIVKPWIINKDKEKLDEIVDKIGGWGFEF